MIGKSIIIAAFYLCSTTHLFADSHSAQSDPGILTSMPPVAPTLVSPENNASNVLSNTLTWESLIHAASYNLEVSTESNFSSFIANKEELTATSHDVTELGGDLNYYWRVSANNVAGTGDYSETWQFHTDQSLPVRLSSFSAELSGGAIVLTWVTESEVDNIGFIIERASAPNYADRRVISSYQDNEALKGWMRENLKETQYRNGDPIQNVTDSSSWSGLSTGARCEYNNSESTANTFGYLYNWYVVNDSRNIAPSGWRVPTESDWSTLVNYLDGFSTAGGKMKATDTKHWQSPNTGATNSSGFSALPGGYRGSTNGSFLNLGKFAYFWLAAEYDTYYAWSLGLHYDSSALYRSYGSKRYGFSIRLIRDH